MSITGIDIFARCEREYLTPPAQKYEYHCPACGEELCIDDTVYTGFNGSVIGCTMCINKKSVEDACEYGDFIRN